jgi:hypothetical protein
MTPIRQPPDRRGVSQGGSVTAALTHAETPSFGLESGNSKLNLPQVNPIYSITMPDRRHPQSSNTGVTLCGLWLSFVQSCSFGT